MAIERTFSIIKPDATARNLTGAINAMIEKAGLRIVAQKRIKMSREQAETFYAVHRAAAVFRRARRFHDFGPGRRAGSGGRQRRCRLPRSHGRDRSQPKPRPARSASSTRFRSAKTRCTAPMPPIPRRRKSPNSSPAMRLSAEPGCGDFDRRISQSRAVARLVSWQRRAIRLRGVLARRSCGSFSSISCCLATMPWSSPWRAANCRRRNDAGAW